MRKKDVSSEGEQKSHGDTHRKVRADARRNLDALLHAAMAVFAVSEWMRQCGRSQRKLVWAWGRIPALSTAV